MWKLLVYMKAYVRESILGPLFKLLEASFELIVPLVVASIIDTGIAGGDRGHVWRMGALLIALGLIGLTCSITAQYFAAKAATGFAAKLRHVLAEHVLALDWTTLDTAGSSTLITRMTSDINQVQSGVNLTLRLFLRSPFIVFGAMIMAFTIDVRAALIFAVVIPLLCLVVFGIMLWSIPQYRRVQGGLDRVLGVTRENLTGVRVIRAFAQEDAERERFRESNESLTKLQLFTGRVTGLMNPVTYVLINAALVVLIRVGAVRVNAGILTQGQVVALVNYMSQILVELVKMANLIINMTKAAACGNRIQSVLELPAAESGTARPDTAGAAVPAVEFRDAGITYAGAGAPSLSGVSFTAMPGQVIGIIGGTGAGKSTLIDLIPGFYRATEGSVRVFGADPSDCDSAVLRGRIGLVPQKAELFQGSIRENLLWGCGSADDEALWKALDIAQASEFVRQREGGLDAPVEQGGRNLSGGQRQRLTIARAVVRRPDILILDDSASALDFATDAALRRALRTLKDTTVFIVSQRTSAVRHADRILVLDDGRLVGSGTHEELLKTCETYCEIWSSQFRKEELA